MEHIGSAGDPFEMGSARPLDFGHWSAHKLEEMTDGSVGHGEAVAIGMALDSLYSHLAGMIIKSELQRIFCLLEELSLPLYHPALSSLDVPVALAEFQEHLGGERCITLLTSIGCKEEVRRIDMALMARCIDELERQFGTKKRSHLDRVATVPTMRKPIDGDNVILHQHSSGERRQEIFAAVRCHVPSVMRILLRSKTSRYLIFGIMRGCDTLKFYIYIDNFPQGPSVCICLPFGLPSRDEGARNKM